MSRILGDTTFTSKHLKIAVQYYHDCLSYFDHFNWVKGEKYDMTYYPSYMGLARKLGKHRETLKNWVDERISDRFFDTYKKIEDLQYELLNLASLSGVIVPVVGIFLLKANYGVGGPSTSELPGQQGPLSLLEHSSQAFITILQTYQTLEQRPIKLLEAKKEKQS